MAAAAVPLIPLKYSPLSGPVLSFGVSSDFQSLPLNSSPGGAGWKQAISLHSPIAGAQIHVRCWLHPCLLDAPPAG